MNQQHQRLVLALTVTLLIAPLLAVAQEEPPAAATGDQALRELAAWKHADARSALEPKKASEGSSAAFKTAWGLLQAQEGKLDEAITELKAAAQVDPADPAPEYYRAQVLYWKRSYDDANSVWQQARDRARAQLEKEPEDARARFFLGASLVRLKQYGDARTELAAAEQAGFDKALVKYQVGLSYTFEKTWDKAKESFDTVLQTDETFAHAYYYRGRVWRELRRTDEMLRDMDRFLKLAPDAPESSIARSLLRAGGG